MKKSGTKSRKKKPNRLHRWLIKNSIFYRSGRKFLKSKFGFFFLSAATLFLVLFLTFHLLNVYHVKRVVRGFERALEEGEQKSVMSFLDLRKENPYRMTFPNISVLIEQKIFFQIKIKRLKFSQKYKWGEVEATIETLKQSSRLDSFDGRLLFNKLEKRLFSWEIAGLESY